MDESMLLCLFDLFEVLFNDLVIYGILAVSNPWLIVPFSVFIVVVIWYRMFYINTERKIQTLEGVSKSPQVQHLASTLNGMSTVRAFQREKDFTKKFSRYNNDFTGARFMLMSSQRWFLFVLEHLQVLFLGGTLFVMVLLADHFSGSLVGFILTNLMMMMTEFQVSLGCCS